VIMLSAAAEILAGPPAAIDPALSTSLVRKIRSPKTGNPEVSNTSHYEHSRTQPEKIVGSLTQDSGVKLPTIIRMAVRR
jgi:hypothetical protein